MTDPRDLPAILRAEVHRVMALPTSERENVLLVELVDSVLRSPRTLPPLPRLGDDHVRRVALRARGDRPEAISESDIALQARQWSLWYALILEALVVDGVELLDRLARRGWWNRFEAVAIRTEAQVRALRGLELPWWPVHRTDVDHRELSILDYAERELGRLNSLSLRRGGAMKSTSGGGWPRPIAPDPRIKDDWSETEALL